MFAERHSTTLTNGITVVSERAPQFHSVAMVAAVRVGSVHEAPEEAGLAHFLEHMVFRGTSSRDGASIARAFAALGAEVNGCTRQDSTGYTAQVLLEDAPRALALLAEMITQPALNEADLALEKTIIADESCSGCWSCQMHEALYGTAYPGQSLTHPVIGHDDTVARIDRDALVAFHRRFYVGRNLTVALCGDLSHHEAVGMVRAAFGDMPAGEAAGYPALRFHGGELHVGSASDHAGLRIGWDVTRFDRATKRALWMFGDILGGHGRSRLMEVLREERGLVYGAWTEYAPVARRDMLLVHLNGPAAKIDDIAGLACDALLALAVEVPTHLLEEAKRRMHVYAFLGADNPRGRVEDMVSDILEMGHVLPVSDRYTSYRALTGADLCDAAQAMLATPPVIVLAAPMRRAPTLAMVRERLDGQAVPQDVREDLRAAS